MKHELENLERAIDRYQRAMVIVKTLPTAANKQDLTRRLMDLDLAIQKLEPYQAAPVALALIEKGHRAMIGGAA